MLFPILQVLIILFFPALMIEGAKRYKLFNWLSPVVWCYVIGMAMANLPFFEVQEDISKTVTNVTVPLAIPMLLFATQFLRWLKNAKSTVISFGLCIVSVVVSSVAAYYIMGDKFQDGWKMAAMMIGTYTGGTVNMSAIKMSLGVNESTFLLMNAADIVLCGVYLLFLLSVAQRALLLFLPAYKKQAGIEEATVDEQPYATLPTKVKVIGILKSVGLAVLIFLVAFGFSFLILGEAEEVTVILTVTTLGIAASFSPAIRKIAGSYQAGEYLLLMFCIAVGSLASVKALADSGGMVFLFVGIVIFSAILLHFLLAALFRIDADTVLITSVAGIYGPAFIGPMANVLKNKEVIIAGLTTGLVGYAIGNYLGLAVAWLLQP